MNTRTPEYSVVHACVFGSLALMLCVGSGVPSVDSKEAPSVEFFGLLKTSDGEKPVTKVRIGGLYNNIPFYGIPEKKEIAPQTDTTFIDLDVLVSVEPVVHPSKENVRVFKGREYVEVIVVLKGSSAKRRYLVEKERKIFCEEITPGVQLQREPLFEAVRKLTIQGYQCNKDHGEKSVLQPDAQRANEFAKRQAVCADVKRDLDILPKKVPQEVINRLKNKIDYLCA